MWHVIAGHGEHRARWRCWRLFWRRRWINRTRARGSSYVLSTCGGDGKVRYYYYRVFHSGIMMYGVSYNVTGSITATLPSCIICMCITDTLQTGDWVFWSKNKLSLLQQIFFCIWQLQKYRRTPVWFVYYTFRISTPVQTGPGAHPASCAMGTGSFSGVKRSGRGADHLPPSKRYTSTHPLGLRGLL